MVELQATVSTESANDTKENLQIEPNSLDQKEPDHKLSAHHDTAFKGDDSDGVVPWTFRSRVAALSLATLYAGAQISLYFVGACLATIAADLEASSEASWLPVAFTLAITAIAPFLGYQQDLFGRRNIALAGVIFVIIGVALVGSARSFGQAVTGMAISGAGAAASELTALAGLSDVVPVRRRGFALALMVATLLPMTPYVLYGQLLATYSTWRWTQWIAIIWNGLTLMGLLFTYFPKGHPRLKGVSSRQIWGQIDYVGAFLSIVGLTLFLVALQAGGYTHPWTSPYVLVQLLIGLLLIVAFVLWEWKFAKYPMIPRELYQGQTVIAKAFLVAFIGGAEFYSLINFFPMSFSTVFDPDPIQVGLKGIGYGLSTIIGAALANSLLSTKIPAKYILLVGAVLMTTFTAGLAATTPETPRLAVAFGILAAFGVGGVVVPAATVALIAAPDSLLATTAALSLSIRTVGGSIAFTIYYNVFVQKLSQQLPRLVGQYAVEAGLAQEDAANFVATYLTIPADVGKIPGVTPEILQGAVMGSRWAYAGSLAYVWYASIPFGVLAILACCFLPDIKKYQTNRVAVAL